MLGAIALGGDTDAMACIAGAIAEAYYGRVPAAIAQQTLTDLDNSLRQTTLTFCAKYTYPYRF